MKRVILTALVASMFFVSCSAQQDKIEKIVKNSIESGKSKNVVYEPLKFSKVKTSERPYEKSESYQLYNNKYETTLALYDLAKGLNEIAKSKKTSFENYEKLLNKYDSIMNAEREQWNVQDEVEITHTYRMKGSLFGSDIISTYTRKYYIDTKADTIVWVETVED